MHESNYTALASSKSIPTREGYRSKASPEDVAISARSDVSSTRLATAQSNRDWMIRLVRLALDRAVARGETKRPHYFQVMRERHELGERGSIVRPFEGDVP